MKHEVIKVIILWANINILVLISLYPQMLSKYRYRWLLNKLRQQSIDLEELNPDLIMEYAKATGAQVLYQTQGYPKCPQLSRDLSKLVQHKLIERKRSYLYDLNGLMVLPQSTYVYHISQEATDRTSWVDR